MAIVELSAQKQAGKILERARHDPAAAERIFNRLSQAEQLAAVLSVPPEDRVRLVEMSHRSRALVRALPVEELYLTVKDLRPADSLSFLQHMSGEQTNFMLDLDVWLGDRPMPERFAEWLAAVYECGAPRLSRFFLEMDLELLAVLVGHWLRVEKWLSSSEEEAPPDDFPGLTLDQVYYFEPRGDEVPPLVVPALELLAERNHERYVLLMEALLWESMTDLEEEAYRFRTGRLMDFGFPDFQDAVAVYRVLDPDAEQARLRRTDEKGDRTWIAESGPRSDFWLAPLAADSLFARAARALPDPDRLKQEVVFLANKVIGADGQPPGDPEIMHRGVTRALALVNLGLEKIAGEGLDQAVERLGAVYLEHIFTLAYNFLRRLRARALELVSTGWIGRMPNNLHVLDEPDDRILAGLLRPFPVYHDPAGGESEYRWFETALELDRRAADLDRIAFWGRLVLDLMDLDVRPAFEPSAARLTPVENRDVTLGTLLLTAAAHHLTGGRAAPAPLPASRLEEALDALGSGLTGLMDQWRSDLAPVLSEAERAWAEALFQAVGRTYEAELARLDRSRPIDPRFIRGLVVVEG